MRALSVLAYLVAAAWLYRRSMAFIDEVATALGCGVDSVTFD